MDNRTQKKIEKMTATELLESGLLDFSRPQLWMGYNYEDMHMSNDRNRIIWPDSSANWGYGTSLSGHSPCWAHCNFSRRTKPSKLSGLDRYNATPKQLIKAMIDYDLGEARYTIFLGYL